MFGGDRDGNAARGRRFDLMSAIGNQRKPRVQRIDCCVRILLTVFGVASAASRETVRNRAMIVPWLHLDT